MEHNKQKLVGNQKLLGKLIPRKEDEKAAKQRINEIRGQQGSYKEILSSENEYLLVDDQGNVRVLTMRWDIGGYHLYENSLSENEFEEVQITFSPSGLNDAIGEYGLGGLLVGGLTGAVVGSLIDSFKGPKKEDVYVSFSFGKKVHWFGNLSFRLIDRKKVRLTEEEFTSIWNEVRPAIETLKRAFPNKASF